MTIQNKILDFTRRHSIRVLDTNKRAVKAARVNIEYFKNIDDYNMMYSTFDRLAETEPLYTVEIAQSELERIAEFEEQVFNHMAREGHYNLFETLMQQKEKEKFLKEKYPAVKKAYEQYSLMLKLAQSGEL